LSPNDSVTKKLQKGHFFRFPWSETHYLHYRLGFSRFFEKNVGLVEIPTKMGFSTSIAILELTKHFERKCFGDQKFP